MPPKTTEENDFTGNTRPDPETYAPLPEGDTSTPRMSEILEATKPRKPVPKVTPVSMEYLAALAREKAESFTNYMEMNGWKFCKWAAIGTLLFCAATAIIILTVRTAWELPLLFFR